MPDLDDINAQIDEMSAHELLALRAADARRLFSGDGAAITDRFRRLARAWHPDRNRGADAPAVFARIVELHRIARQGCADAPARIFRTADGRSFRLRWRKCHRTDFGELLVGDHHVAHLVQNGCEDLVAAAEAFRPTYADARMRAEIEPLLPRRVVRLETADGHVFVERKAPDQILLRDLIALGAVDPRHAAWMTTRLLNIACWLAWAGIAHGAIGPDALLVSPARHAVTLTGPLLCAGGFGTAPVALPERSLACQPRYALAGACLDARLDPELLRLTLREMLGDAAGTGLALDRAVPAPFAAWLTLPTTGDAWSDFTAWEGARKASFGARRFVRWDVDVAAAMAA